MTATKKEKRIDWVCRILITLQLLLVIRGYIAFLQAKYQLVSPLIPQSVIYEISYPYIIASLIASGFMLITLWLYFLNKKNAAICVGGISLLTAEMWVLMFVK